MVKVYTKMLKNVNEKNIDKFNDYVIKLNFNNIFITYIVYGMKQMREMNGFGIA